MVSYDPCKVSKAIAIFTSVFLFEMFADMNSIAGSTKISHFFMRTERSSVTASALWPDLLMLADGTTTTFVFHYKHDRVIFVCFGDKFDFLCIRNKFLGACQVHIFCFFMHFFVVLTFWTTLCQLCSSFVDPKTFKY